MCAPHKTARASCFWLRLLLAHILKSTLFSDSKYTRTLTFENLIQGRQFQITKETTAVQAFCAAPEGYDSVKAVGKSRPDPKGDVTLQLDGTDVKFATVRVRVHVRVMCPACLQSAQGSPASMCDCLFVCE